MKTYDYEFKIFAGNMLVFNALIAKETSNFLIVPLAEIGIDESFKDIFTRVIKGDFRLDYIEKDDFENLILDSKEMVINEGSAYENLKKFESISEKYLYLKTEITPTSFHEIIKFRYDGPHYHMGYGLPYKEAGILEELSNDLVDAITGETSGFGTILQTQREAASTAIPYMSQTYDIAILDIVKKCINDVNKQKIDLDFISQGTKNSKIYKKFLEKLSHVSKLKDLDAFEVFILDKKLEVKDLSSLKEIKSKLYDGNEQFGRGKVRYFQPHKNRTKGTLCISVDGLDQHFHVYVSDDTYDKVRQIGNTKEGKEVSYRAIQTRESTYQLITISEI